MARKMYEERYISDIAVKIREKTGGSTTYKTAEMPGGIEDVYNSGKKAEYDAFWEPYQDYGKRVNYAYAFAGRGWTRKLLRPKYPFGQISNATEMFNAFGGDESGSLDLAQYLSELGLTLDLSKSTASTHMFSEAYISHVPELNFTSHRTIWVFMNSSQIKTIDKIILKSDGSTIFQTPFQNARSLENVVFEGVIGQNGLSFAWSSLLSNTSITSVINALSTTTSGLTVTISKTAVNNAFETAAGTADGQASAEWLNLIATRSNWTVNLLDS